ncbi:MAG: bactofilin family protein [Thermodesulfobacteriota bacterium]
MSGKSIFSKGDSKSSSSHEDISAFLGKESLFEGKMSFQGVFRLEGRFEGEIFESGILIVGESAKVKGKIEVNSIIINGMVEGDIIAQEKVEIHSTGQFYGTLLTPILIVNEGGILQGQCQMKNHSTQLSQALPSYNKDEAPMSS